MAKALRPPSELAAKCAALASGPPVVGRSSSPPAGAPESPTMGSHLEKNLAALAARWPELAALAEAPPSERFELFEDGAARPNLRARGGSEPWYAPDVESALAPLDVPAVSRRRLLLQFGLGLGHELLFVHGRRRQGQMMVIEQDPEVLRWAVRACDLSAALSDETVDLVVGQSVEQLGGTLHARFLHQRYLSFAKSAHFVVSAGALAQDAGYVLGAVRRVREMLVAALGMYGNCANDALMGVENIVRNLGVIARAPNAADAAGRLAGRPAIVASAGPSLAAHLPLLAKVQDEFPIFCPDTSIRILREAGIRPHVATSRERVVGTTRHFESLPPVLSGDADAFALVGFPVLPPAVFEVHRGPTALLYRPGDWHEWLGIDGPPFDFNGSAGNLAYRVAALLGCDPIVLVGQDLCFAEGGQTHAPGSLNGSAQQFYHDLERIHLPGSRGGQVESSPVWEKFLRYFELDVAALPNRVWNATARGAHIRGTRVVDLEAALAELPRGADPRAEILGLFVPPPGPEARAARLHRRVVNTRRGVRAIAEVTELGVRYITQAAERFRPPVATDIDLGKLAAEDPYKTLAGLKETLLNRDPVAFRCFLLPIFQSLFVTMEMERFGAEAAAETPAELGRFLVEQAGQWFSLLQEITSRADAILALDEPRSGPRFRAKKRKAIARART